MANGPRALFTTTNATPVVAEQPAGPAWSFSASAYAYFPPDSQDYVQPTIRADRGWLHLEARYNYEALDTGSAWLGANFALGDRLSLAFTPMVGGVFGNTTGFAPGYKGSLSWWKLELSSESEYVVDVGDSSNNFFYNWTDITYSIKDWLWFGISGQRTRLFQTNVDIQRGLLIGGGLKQWELNGYWYNIGSSDNSFVILALSKEF
jgi:hypothetical protein